MTDSGAKVVYQGGAPRQIALRLHPIKLELGHTV